MKSRYSRYSGLRVEQDGHLLRVILDNPPLNAMTAMAHTELTSIWAAADDDPTVRVILFTGAGDKAFCAGGDLNAMVANFGNRDRWQAALAEARNIIVGMLSCKKPVISRINGHAMGLGASLALAGDITIMVDDAKIGDSHVRIGLATGDGGALLWPHLMGLVGARRYLLTGDPLTGAEAAGAGLVTEAVPRDRLDGRVEHWIERFLSTAPLALQATKQALNLDIASKARAFMSEMLQLETVSWESPNHLEAVEAALERRPPQFTDK